MSESTGVTSHRGIPSGIVGVVESVLTTHMAAVGILDSQNYKLKHYAGEFLAEDNLNRLVADVSQFSYVMWDVEMIDETGENSDLTMAEDTFSLILFCCVSNRFSESSQWSSSYDLAWDVRRAFQGVSFDNVADIHSNGYFTPLSIERELHVPGMSVHTFRMDATIVHDVNGVTP